MLPASSTGHDGNGARFIEARVDITDRCNLQCPHCVRHARSPGSGHEMELATLRRIADQVFVRAHTVHLACAGEPLMSPLFEEAVRCASRHRVGRICLVTNGALLNEKRARFCIDEGVAEITISLESSQAERFARHRVGTSLEAVLANVDRLRRMRDERALARPKLHFNVIVMRDNLEELEAIADLCRAHGGERIRFGYLVVDNEAMRGEAPFGHAQETIRAVAALQAHVNGWPVEVEIPPALESGAALRRCAQAWTGLFISVDGDVWPCFRLQSQPFGNLATSDLDDILDGDAWRRLHWEHAAGLLRWQCRVCPETGSKDAAGYENPLWLTPQGRAADPAPPADPAQALFEVALARALRLRFAGDPRASDRQLRTALAVNGRGDERATFARVLERTEAANTAWMLAQLMETRYDVASMILAYRRFLELCAPGDPRRAPLAAYVDRIEVEHELAVARRALAEGRSTEAVAHLTRALAIDPGISEASTTLDEALGRCAARIDQVRYSGTLLGIGDVASTAWHPRAILAAFERYLAVEPHGRDHEAVSRSLRSVEALVRPRRGGRLRGWAGAALPRVTRQRRAAASPPPVREVPRGLVLRMDVNNRCNLRCIQCTLEKNRREQGEAPSDMPLDLFRLIVEQVMPCCDSVALSCEAEPTLHPELEAMIRMAARPGGSALTLTTNGSMLTDRLLAAMLDAPLAGLNVSVDGASEETFGRLRRGGDIHRVGDALERLAAMKRARGLDERLSYPRLQINVTVMRSNLHEIEAIAGMAERWRAHRLVAQHVYALEANGLAAESAALDGDRWDDVLARTSAWCRSRGIETTFPPPFAPPAGPIVSAATGDGPWCEAPWRMVRIWWNGLVYPCDLWGRDGAPMGDLRSQSFLDVWNGPAYTALRRGLRGDGPLHARCAGCTMVTTDNLERRRRSSATVLQGT